MIVIEGKCFLEGRLEQCCLGIDDGKIVSVKKILEGDERFDFGDNLILPSGIDIHVHFREPGKTHKEDFFTGTLAAAFGGVTCALDMPNNIPPINSVAALKEKLDVVKRKANIDFGLYSVLIKHDDIDELSELVTGFKIYMAETTDAAGITTGYDKLDLLINTAPAKKVVSIHCEDDRFLKMIEEKNLNDHFTARPTKCEVEGLKLVLKNRRNINRNIHIAHLSSAEGLEFVNQTKPIVPFTVEVTVHHMFLNIDSDLKTFGKVNPPLRNKSDNEALRNAFFNGTIDVLASDHAPHTVEEKNVGFSDAPSGIPGVETNIPIMLRMVKKDSLTLQRFVEATSTIPANLFKLNKGALEIGRDADLIVVDMKNVKNIRADELHSKCGWTPYESFEAIFPKTVFLRGKMIVEDGNLMDERLGKYVG